MTNNRNLAATSNFQQRLNTLTADDIIVVSAITGPQSIETSLNDLLTDYLKCSTGLRTILRDAEFLALINRSVESREVERYISGKLYEGDSTQGIDHPIRVTFFKILCELAVEHRLPGILSRVLPDIRAADVPFKTLSLAHTLWTAWPELNRIDAVWVSAFILADDLKRTQSPPAPAPPVQPMDLRGYQDLRTVVIHLLAVQPGESLFARLMQQLPTDILMLATGKFRLLTKKEKASALHSKNQMDANGIARVRGIDLTHTPGLALEAILNSTPFLEFEKQLIAALEWYAPANSQHASQSMSRQLTVQALIDCIYPVEQRRAGYILDFHLFDPDNADCTFSDIRIDLTNSLSQTLGCSTGYAQIAMQLLLTRFAPELLLDDAPEDFRYQPDLRWANLRHAMRLRAVEAEARTFAQWETLPTLQAATAATLTEKLRLAISRTEPMIVWGIYAKVITDKPDYLPDELARLTRHFESACNQHALNVLPDRLTDARQLLIDAGIDPDAMTAGANSNTTQLEAYLDGGEHYRPPQPPKSPLPDVTHRFNQAFDRYEKEARQTYKDLIRIFLDELPEPDRTRLTSGTLKCYAVFWRQYVGSVTGGIPAFDSSSDRDWQDCRGGHGCVVHVSYGHEHFLYELFPESNTARHRVLNPQDAQRLEDSHIAALFLTQLIDPDHSLYNGKPLPYDKSGLAGFVRLPTNPDVDNAGQLVQAMVEPVFLHHVDALRAACKGTTQAETRARLRESTSDGAYAWNLIRSIIPIVGCFDVRTGSDAASCVADVAGEIRSVITVAGRTFRPLIKLGAKTRLRSSHPALLLGPRRQNARWFAGRDGELPLFEHQLLATHNAVAIGKHLQRRAVFQGVPGSSPEADVAWHSARVDGIDDVLVRNVSTVETPDYRWWNPLDQKPYGPRLSALGGTPATEPAAFATTQNTVLPGQFPGAVQLSEAGEHGHDLSITANRTVQFVHRDEAVSDLIIDDVSYRFNHHQASLLRKVELEPRSARLHSLEEVPVVCRVKRGLTEVDCTGSLILMSTARTDADPAQAPLGQGEHASQAFMTRRYRPAIQRRSQRGNARPAQTNVLVDDGKISTWIDEVIPGRGGSGTQKTGRKILSPLPPQDTLHLGLSTSPQYRARVSGRLMKDQRLGLPEVLDDSLRKQIDEQLPVVQLDSICTTINDQRELRGVRLSLPEGRYIAVEADTGQFYKALEPSGDGQLSFTRMTSQRDIDAFLRASEGYRLGAGRRTLNRDMDNIAKMLFELELGQGKLKPGTTYESSRSRLENYARKILTEGEAQQNFVKLTKSSIPDFKQLADVDPVMRQHIASVFDALLPATGARNTWLPVSSAELPLIATGVNVRKHLNSTNLAFLMAENSDGSHHIYYALAGGKRGKGLTLQAPVTHEGSSMNFIDARARMSGRSPDPGFTSLPVVRTSEKLNIREHDRYLDAERLIATAFKEDMRVNPSLTKIHFFTLMDTCNSCGGFVMPRLKLDFPSAEFSVSYILPYTQPI